MFNWSNRVSAYFNLIMAGSALHSWIINILANHDPLNGYAIAYLSCFSVFVFMALVRLGKIKGIEPEDDGDGD